MLKALNEQSADGYYDLLENKLVPVAKQFDNDMRAFRAWAFARQSGGMRRAGNKTRADLIIVAALRRLGIIIAGGWFCAICCSSRFGLDCPAGTCGGRGFNRTRRRAGI